MDYLTFSIRLIEALAWPLAAVAVAYTFRAEARKLMPLVRRLKAGPIEAEFDRSIQEISEEVTASPDDAERKPSQDEWRELLVNLAAANPPAAVLEAWSSVEATVKRAALQRITTSPPPDVSSALRAARMLAEVNAISQEDLAMFNDLRGLRNQAANVEVGEISPSSALKFIHLAKELQSRFEELATPDHSR